MARGALKEIGVDYVLVLPLPHSLHKMGASPFLDRLRMAQLAFAHDERLLVPADSRSARQIIFDLKAINPHVEVLGVVGSDYISGKVKWQLNRLYQKFTGIDMTAVVLRDRKDATELESFRSEGVETYRLTEVRPESSTQVRNGNLSMVDPPVAQYILSNNLYGLKTRFSCSRIFAQ